jgi:hypothetical protein
MKFTSNPTGEYLLKMDSVIHITNIITNKKNIDGWKQTLGTETENR